MAAHVNPAYYQHSGAPKTHMIAVVNPAYFQPGSGHHMSAAAHAGRGGGGRAKAKAKKATMQRIHGSPMPTMHDPFGHRGMGRVRGR